MILRILIFKLYLIYEIWTSDHILHAFLLDFIHVTLVLKHATQIINPANVAHSHLLELNCFFLDHIFVHFSFGIVWVILGTRLVCRIIFFHAVNDVKALLNFLKEALRWVCLSLSTLIAIICNVKKFTSSNLIKAVSLTGILVKHLINQIFELSRMRDALEYLPVLLSLTRW